MTLMSSRARLERFVESVGLAVGSIGHQSKIYLGNMRSNAL
jgi:hypothetical protein